MVTDYRLHLYPVYLLSTDVICKQLKNKSRLHYHMIPNEYHISYAIPPQASKTVYCFKHCETNLSRSLAIIVIFLIEYTNIPFLKLCHPIKELGRNELHIATRTVEHQAGIPVCRVEASGHQQGNLSNKNFYYSMIHFNNIQREREEKKIRSIKYCTYEHYTDKILKYQISLLQCFPHYVKHEREQIMLTYSQWDGILSHHDRRSLMLG